MKTRTATLANKQLAMFYEVKHNTYHMTQQSHSKLIETYVYTNSTGSFFKDLERREGREKERERNIDVWGWRPTEPHWSGLYRNIYGSFIPSHQKLLTAECPSTRKWMTSSGTSIQWCTIWQLKRWNYWCMQHHGWILKLQGKEARFTKLHAIRFHLYSFQKMQKTIETEVSSVAARNRWR